MLCFVSGAFCYESIHSTSGLKDSWDDTLPSVGHREFSSSANEFLYRYIFLIEIQYYSNVSLISLETCLVSLKTLLISLETSPISLKICLVCHKCTVSTNGLNCNASGRILWGKSWVLQTCLFILLWRSVNTCGKIKTQTTFHLFIYSSLTYNCKARLLKHQWHCWCK